VPSAVLLSPRLDGSQRPSVSVFESRFPQRSACCPTSRDRPARRGQV